jgi:hypothetical protein
MNLLKVDMACPIISLAVKKHIDKTGSVYTDDLMEETGVSRETITKWLRKEGFVKTGNLSSKRWQRETPS